MRRAGWSVLVLLLVAAATHVSAGMKVLKPESVRPLAARFGREVKDVAWQDDGSLLLASDRGVFHFVLRTGEGSEILAGTPVPEGLPAPMAIATDGVTLEAVSPHSSGTFALRLKDQKRLLAQQSPKMIASDVGVRGDRACFLGFAARESGDLSPTTAVVCGGLSDPWDELKGLHTIHSGDGAAEIYRYSVPPYAGALLMEADGVVDVITSAEPGVYRYSPSGALLGVLGSSLRELVLEDAEDIVKHYAVDVDRRYRALLNRQATIDGLIATSEGPALVVRLAADEVVHWELWFPEAAGGATRRARLGVDRAGPFGHLRCSSRGSRLACVGSSPSAKDAVDPRKSETSPTLWLFQLPRSGAKVP